MYHIPFMSQKTEHNSCFEIDIIQQPPHLLQSKAFSSSKVAGGASIYNLHSWLFRVLKVNVFTAFCVFVNNFHFPFH